MNSTLENNEPIYIRCECGSSHHHLCFDYDPEFWGPDEISVAFVSHRAGSFWRRIVNSVKHIFGGDLVIADIIVKREKLKEILDR